jgi:TonB family protein
MTRKFFAFAALLLFTFPAFTQTAVRVPAAMATDASTPLKIGGDVLPPKLIFSVEPKFKRPLFHKPKPGIVLVGLTVPADGVPIDIHVIKSGGRTFDKSALTAVKQYRFQPATQHGKPVPVKIRIEVQFQVY